MVGKAFREVKKSIPPAHRRLFLILGGLYAAWWTYWAIDPHHRTDWWLENVLVFFIFGFLFVTGRWFVFSRTSYILTFLFLCLHTLGSHYTYSEVPYDAWFQALTGRSIDAMFGWERNHFDRLVHFLYGLLATWSYREAFHFAANTRRVFWSYLLVLSFNLATSTLYELLEWGAAVLYGGDLGMAFLGTQGDPWDAHRDILLAAYGALLCFGVMIILQLATGRDFAREWGESRRPSS